MLQAASFRLQEMRGDQSLCSWNCNWLGKNKKSNLGLTFSLLRREDSNFRPSGYEPDELPLLYFAMWAAKITVGGLPAKEFWILFQAAAILIHSSAQLWQISAHCLQCSISICFRILQRTNYKYLSIVDNKHLHDHCWDSSVVLLFCKSRHIPNRVEYILTSLLHLFHASKKWRSNHKLQHIHNKVECIPDKNFA